MKKIGNAFSQRRMTKIGGYLVQRFEHKTPFMERGVRYR
jgi:hypothetical protein